MSAEERIQKILDTWRGHQRLKEDSWQNVQLVLNHYGFSYERKTEWVCTHPQLFELAKNPRARDLLNRVGLGLRGEFVIAVTHGAGKKTDRVLRCYLNNVLKAVELLEVITKGREAS